MPQPDLQLGGGYTYQWRCSILLGLAYLDRPFPWNEALHDLITRFLGAVDAVHLEGETIASGISLEDVNLFGRGPGGLWRCTARYWVDPDTTSTGSAGFESFVRPAILDEGAGDIEPA